MKAMCIFVKKSRNMKKKLFIGVCMASIVWLAFISCDSNRQNLVIDIPKIINKSPEEVKKALGEPDSSILQPIFNKKVLTFYYTANVVEIRFFENIASEIIVRKTDNIPFDENSLKLFGVSPQTPTEKKENLLITWNTYPEFKTVSFYTKYRNPDGSPKIYEIFFKGK